MILFSININCISLINKSLSGKVLSIKDKSPIVFPALSCPKYFLVGKLYMVWKICIDNISSKDCSLKFIVHTGKVSLIGDETLYYYLLIYDIF